MTQSPDTNWLPFLTERELLNIARNPEQVAQMEVMDAAEIIRRKRSRGRHEKYLPANGHVA